QVYFWTWLLFSSYYIFRRNINRTNRETLLMGSTLAFIVPIVNGIVSKNWVWNNLFDGNIDLFSIDFLWLCIGLVGICIYRKIKMYPKSPASNQLPQYSLFD